MCRSASLGALTAVRAVPLTKGKTAVPIVGAQWNASNAANRGGLPKKNLSLSRALKQNTATPSRARSGTALRQPATKPRAHDAHVVGNRFCEERAPVEAATQACDKDSMETLVRNRTNLRARSTTPRAMRVAFTDRAVRMREGLQGKEALQHAEPVSDSTCCAGSSYLACDPFSQPAAGQLSTECGSHKFQSVHATPRAAFSESRHIDSSGVTKILNTMNEDSISSAKACIGDPDSADQFQFRHELGAKLRVGQSRSVGPGSAAGHHRHGGFLIEDAKGLVERRVRRGPSVERTSGRKTAHEDPDSLRLTTSYNKRANGEYKVGPSTTAEKHHLHTNQPLYRFEVKAVEALERPSGTVTPRSLQNPISMESTEAHASFVDHPTFRSGMSNASKGITQAMNHASMGQDLAVERQRRLASEPCFAELCGHVAEVSAGTGIGRRTHKQLTGIADALKWDA